MNYIELINQFWQTRRSKRITSLQADLYFYLLNECNVRGWENPFEVSNGLICASIGITEPSLIDARNRLQQYGLIEFQGGKRNVQSPVYYLKSYLNDNLNDLSRNRATSLVTSLVETELKGEPSYKQNKTKLNEEEPPLPPLEEKQVKVKPKKYQPDALQFPFSGNEFMDTWNRLASMPKWKKKLPLSLQMSLDKLAKYDEAFSIELMKRAIEGNYQGVVFNDTDSAYLKWKSQNQKGSGQRPGQILQPVSEERKNQLLKNFQ